MNVFLAVVVQTAADLTTTPVGILVAVNGVMTVAFGKLYRDCRLDHKECREDREKLWSHIRDLEKRSK